MTPEPAPLIDAVIRRSIRRMNTDHEMRALIQLTLGLIFTTVLFGVVFAVTLLACLLAGRGRGLALTITGVLLGAAFWSAWRRVDPLQGAPDGGADDALAALGAWRATGLVHLAPRQSLAGAAALLIAGPLSILEAALSWRSRIRVEPGLDLNAADLLQNAAHGVDLERIDDPRAAALLRRLRLVKIEPRPPGLGRLVLTQRGRDALREGGILDR